MAQLALSPSAHALTCPLDHNSNNQTHVLMIYMWIKYLIAVFWLVVYTIIFVTDNAFLSVPLRPWTSLRLGDRLLSQIDYRLWAVRLFMI